MFLKGEAALSVGKRGMAMRKFFASLGLLMLAPLALAQSVYDPITTAVDWSAVNSAVISIFALIAAVYVVFKGGKLILRALRGA